MRRSAIGLWLGVGVLGSTLGMGCGRETRPCEDCGKAVAQRVVAKPVAAPEAPAVAATPSSPYSPTTPASALPPPVPVRTFLLSPAPPGPAVPAPSQPMAPPTSNPITVPPLTSPERPTPATLPPPGPGFGTSAAPSSEIPVARSVDTALLLEPPPCKLIAGAGAAHNAEESESGILPVKNRVHQTTTRSPFDHAPDYSWLVGTLEPGREFGTWSVRYCAVDEEEPFGGSVTLVEPGETSAFQLGRRVRVEGMMLQNAARVFKPNYRVQKVTFEP